MAVAGGPNCSPEHAAGDAHAAQPGSVCLGPAAGLLPTEHARPFGEAFAQASGGVRLVFQLADGGDILQAQLNRIHADLLGKRIHHLFQRPIHCG